MAPDFNPSRDQEVKPSDNKSMLLSPNTGRWILIATILGSSMSFIDGTAVSIALPSVQTDFDATLLELQWVVEAYALCLASLMLVGGSMGDRMGRRRVFTIGVVLFSLASLWCGLSPSASHLIAARAAQGIGGAFLVPGSLAIIRASFNEEMRGRAIGTWSGATAITAAIGPLLGGYLVEAFSWRWIFFINLPLAIMIVAVVFTRVPESRSASPRGSLDGLGAGLSVLGLGGLVFGFLESSEKGLSHPVVLTSLAVGTLSLLLFLWMESRATSPIMPLGLYRSRTFTGATILTLLLYAALGGSLFFVPFNLIQIQGYSATAAGAAWLPFIIFIAALSQWSGRVVLRYGAKLPLVIGPAVAAVGFGLLALPGVGGSYWTNYFPAFVALGFGMGITIAPLVTVVMSSVGSDQAGIASGVNNAMARIASLLAIAVFGSIALGVFNSSLDRNLERFNVPAHITIAMENEKASFAGAQVPLGTEGEFLTYTEQAINEAFISGFRFVMLIAVGLALGSSLVALLLVDSRYKPRTLLE